MHLSSICLILVVFSLLWQMRCRLCMHHTAGGATDVLASSNQLMTLCDASACARIDILPPAVVDTTGDSNGSGRCYAHPSSNLREALAQAYSLASTSGPNKNDGMTSHNSSIEKPRHACCVSSGHHQLRGRYQLVLVMPSHREPKARVHERVPPDPLPKTLSAQLVLEHRASGRIRLCDLSPPVSMLRRCPGSSQGAAKPCIESVSPRSIQMPAN